MSALTGPAWNLETEYPSLESLEFQRDEGQVHEVLKTLSELQAEFDRIRSRSVSPFADTQLLPVLKSAMTNTLQAWTLSSNLSTYAYCRYSVDANDVQVKKKMSELEELSSKLSQAYKPFELFLVRAEDSLIDKLLNDDELKGFRFQVMRQRLQKDFLLSEAEEKLLLAMGTSGHHGWGNLYSSLAGTVRVRVQLGAAAGTSGAGGEAKEMGLAEAFTLVTGSDQEDRKAAWHGIQEAWKAHQESAAAILNSLADWRHQEYRLRSHTREMRFLDRPVFSNRIEMQTLEAMMQALREHRMQSQRATKWMAEKLGQKQLNVWDVLAPGPSEKLYPTQGSQVSYDDAIGLIRSAFATVSSEMAEFVDRAVEGGWVEGRVMDGKTTGGYCTEFAKSRTPRIYMTYKGSMHDVSTLAHELGHAFHSWVMRDLHEEERGYPMTLAETASIFAETVVSEALIKQAKSEADRVAFQWSKVDSVAGFMLNIPMRFEFERDFYEMRKSGFVTSSELCVLMEKTWRNWYGETVIQADPMFWAHKLHFSMSGASFYNFPYSFGYLFALGIYAKREQWGGEFFSRYKALLRDTGRMTSEDLVAKHLGDDIRRPEFWNRAVSFAIKSALGEG